MISNTKISFGFDLYYLMKSLEILGSGKVHPFQDAADSLFLFYWEFSTDDVNEIHHIFENKRMDERKMPDIGETINRLIATLKSDPIACERLLIQLFAITFLGPQSEKMINFVDSTGEHLDLKPSQIKDYFRKGFDLASYIKYIGTTYSINQE